MSPLCTRGLDFLHLYRRASQSVRLCEPYAADVSMFCSRFSCTRVFCKVATIAPLEDVRADALKVTASS